MKSVIVVSFCLLLAFLLLGCTSQKAVAMYDLIPMVMVDGDIYYDTGRIDTSCPNFDFYDKEITSSVDGSEIPSENNQSNFGAGFKYRFGEADGTIVVFLNKNACIFERHNNRWCCIYTGQNNRRCIYAGQNNRCCIYAGQNNRRCIYAGRKNRCCIYPK